MREMTATRLDLGIGLTARRARERLIQRLMDAGIDSPEVLRVMRAAVSSVCRRGARQPCPRGLGAADRCGARQSLVRHERGFGHEILRPALGPCSLGWLESITMDATNRPNRTIV
ncbi:MAG: hypothetical protein ACUVT0_04510 [Thermochromatium sp.]